MEEKNPGPSLSERIGYSTGAVIGFIIIFAIGLFALWVTMDPFH